MSIFLYKIKQDKKESNKILTSWDFKPQVSHLNFGQCDKTNIYIYIYMKNYNLLTCDLIEI